MACGGPGARRKRDAATARRAAAVGPGSPQSEPRRREETIGPRHRHEGILRGTGARQSAAQAEPGGPTDQWSWWLQAGSNNAAYHRAAAARHAEARGSAAHQHAHTAAGPNRDAHATARPHDDPHAATDADDEHAAACSVAAEHLHGTEFDVDLYGAAFDFELYDIELEQSALE